VLQNNESSVERVKKTRNGGQERTQNFSLEEGGADPEAIYNLCFILKIVLKNPTASAA
jgi:hypothetical protein